MVKTTKLNLPQRPRRLRRYPSLCCAGMLACLAAVAGFAAKPAAVPPRNSIGRDLADRQGDGEKEELSAGCLRLRLIGKIFCRAILSRRWSA